MGWRAVVGAVVLCGAWGCNCGGPRAPGEDAGTGAGDAGGPPADGGASDSGGPGDAGMAPTLISLSPVPQYAGAIQPYTVTASGMDCTLSFAPRLEFALNDAGPPVVYEAGGGSCTPTSFVAQPPASLPAGHYFAFIDEPRSGAPDLVSNRIETDVLNALAVQSVNPGRGDMQELTPMHVGAQGLVCTPSLPTMALTQGGVTVQTVSASACTPASNVARFDLTASAAGAYTLVFTNGDGTPDRSGKTWTLQVDAACGLTQMAIGTGHGPALAARDTEAMIAVIDGSPGVVTLLPRSADLATPLGPPLVTGIQANSVAIATDVFGGGSGNYAYVVAWASADQVGAFYVNGDGGVARAGPPALPTTAPTQLQVATVSGLGLIWQEDGGAIRVAMGTSYPATWSSTPTLADAGSWPSIAAAFVFGDFTVAWQDTPTSFEQTRATILTGSFGNPNGFALAALPSMAWDVSSANLVTAWIETPTGQPNVFDQQHQYPQDWMGPIAWPLPLALWPSVGTPAVAYPDVFGGVTIEALGAAKRVGQPFDPALPPSISWLGASRVGWVLEKNGQLYAGTLCVP